MLATCARCGIAVPHVGSDADFEATPPLGESHCDGCRGERLGSAEGLPIAHGSAPSEAASPAPMPVRVPTFLTGETAGGSGAGTATSSRSGSSALLMAAIAGFALSFCIEYTQSHLPMRESSSFDLCMNSLGSVAGALIAIRLVPRRLQQWMNSPESATESGG